MINKETEYFSNVIGLSNLSSWLSRWYKFEKSFKITEKTIFIDGLISGRFILGIPKNKKFGENIFLAIQPEEMLWFKNITWSHFSIDLINKRLHLVSKKIKAFNDKTEDLPAFSIAILFDSLDKIKFIESQKILDIRELWYEDNGSTEHISRNASLNSLPVILLKTLENGEVEPVIYDNTPSSNKYNDLLSKKIT